METPNRVKPDEMVSPGRKVDACSELLLLAPAQEFAFRINAVAQLLHVVIGGSVIVC